MKIKIKSKVKARYGKDVTTSYADVENSLLRIMKSGENHCITARIKIFANKDNVDNYKPLRVEYLEVMTTKAELTSKNPYDLVASKLKERYTNTEDIV